MRLADLGARVIKIERPGTGDIGRTLAFAGRAVDGDTVSFHAMNRNKESITADLKVPSDLAYVTELVARADVIIQNFRPGVMERIGLDYESVRAINPVDRLCERDRLRNGRPVARPTRVRICSRSRSRASRGSAGRSPTGRCPSGCRSPTICSAATSRRA